MVNTDRQASLDVHIGIAEEPRKELAAGLERLLASTYALYVKTQGFHWNVTGPHFFALHAAFEEQYRALGAAADLIAERVRALGFPVAVGLGAFAERSEVEETRGVPTDEAMVSALVRDHETVIRVARALMPVADAAADQTTQDLVAERLAEHEKTAWMLRSFLG